MKLKKNRSIFDAVSLDDVRHCWFPCGDIADSMVINQFHCVKPSVSYPQVIHNEKKLKVKLALTDTLVTMIDVGNVADNWKPFLGAIAMIETATVTVNVKDNGFRALERAIGKACRDIGVYRLGALRRIVIVHGQRVRLPIEAIRAFRAGLTDYSFSLTAPVAESWGNIFGAGHDDVNDIGD